MIVRTFATDKETYQKFKEICSREYLNIGETLTELIKNYVQEKDSKSESSNQKESKVIHIPDFFSENRLWKEYMISSEEINNKCSKQLEKLCKINDDVFRNFLIDSVHPR